MNMNVNKSTPWVEVWRPTNMDSIVLDPFNKTIFQYIIDNSYFPNLLFYGPPGTGKTTSIINLVNAYQEKNNGINKSLMIHLNASDERGIETIRCQINSFVNSNGLFNQGMKFIILDEVDYMTKNAQQALRYLLQNYSNSVRFCLICNYISRIDEGLQNEFIRLRFNQLPQQEIIQFLQKIAQKENLSIKKDCLYLIQKQYKSDIRSMINFMQSNQHLLKREIKIVNLDVWMKLFDTIQLCIASPLDKKEHLDTINKEIQEISINYNMDKKNIIKEFLNFLIRNKPYLYSNQFFAFVENIMHFQDCHNKYYLNYCFTKLFEFFEIAKSKSNL